MLYRIVTAITSGLTLYLGNGLMKQSSKAREIAVYFMAYGIINAVFGFTAVDEILENTPGLYSEEVLAIASITAIVTLIITAAINGALMNYLIRKKDYFVNA